MVLVFLFVKKGDSLGDDKINRIGDGDKGTFSPHAWGWTVTGWSNKINLTRIWFETCTSNIEIIPQRSKFVSQRPEFDPQESLKYYSQKLLIQSEADWKVNGAGSCSGVINQDGRFSISSSIPGPEKPRFLIDVPSNISNAFLDNSHYRLGDVHGVTVNPQHCLD